MESSKVSPPSWARTRKRRCVHLADFPAFHNSKILELLPNSWAACYDLIGLKAYALTKASPLPLEPQC